MRAIGRGRRTGPGGAQARAQGQLTAASSSAICNWRAWPGVTVAVARQDWDRRGGASSSTVVLPRVLVLAQPTSAAGWGVKACGSSAQSPYSSLHGNCAPSGSCVSAWRARVVTVSPVSAFKPISVGIDSTLNTFVSASTMLRFSKGSASHGILA